MDDYQVQLRGQWWSCSLERAVVEDVECVLWVVRCGREFVAYNSAALAHLLAEGRARRVSPRPPQPSIAAAARGRMRTS